MRVTRLQLRDFRSYEAAELRLGPGLTVVAGPQRRRQDEPARGAVLRAAPGRSCRTANEREVVRFGAPLHAAGCSRRRDDRGAHEITVGFQPGRAEAAAVDGAPVERLTDSAARPLVSVFLPDRLELVLGAPALRRAHLDQVVAALWPAPRRHAPRLLRRARAAQRADRGGSAPAAPVAARCRPGTPSSRATASR